MGQYCWTIFRKVSHCWSSIGTTFALQYCKVVKSVQNEYWSNTWNNIVPILKQRLAQYWNMVNCYLGFYMILKTWNFKFFTYNSKSIKYFQNLFIEFGRHLEGLQNGGKKFSPKKFFEVENSKKKLIFQIYRSYYQL